MSAIYDRVVKCLECVRAKTDFVPKVALVLGSGLGDYGNEIQVEAIVDYHDIEGFPVSTVPGHSGSGRKLADGESAGTRAFPEGSRNPAADNKRGAVSKKRQKRAKGKK